MDRKRTFKIFDIPWHCGHQFEMFKIPNCEFYLLLNSCREWADKARPLPKNVKWVPYYEKGKYDLAILHVDQQSIDPNLANKNTIYKELNNEIKDIPKIVINHGSPVWPEWYQDKNEIIIKMRELIGDNLMVVNSHKAVEEWKDSAKNIVPIIHGLDPDDWHDLKKEARVITAVSPAGLDAYYNRRLYDETQVELGKRGIQIVYIRRHIFFDNWDQYRDYLGKSLIYFDFSLHTPMNRARTEAMLSGCCVVTAKSHDVERFIVDGENGFITLNNPISAANIIEKLLFDYELALKVGQKGKETAKKFFSKERYQKDWLNLLDRVVSNN
jgi:glycosyltransferase involved in cell wall biosynthesis